jgi:hypothetical protein
MLNRQIDLSHKNELAERKPGMRAGLLLFSASRNVTHGKPPHSMTLRQTSSKKLDAPSQLAHY